MDTWLLISLLAPILFALNNIIDQILIRKYFSDFPALAIYVGALVYILFIPFVSIFFWQSLKIDLATAGLLISLGFASLFIWIPYFKALDKIDSSVAMPLLQTNPVFVYALALAFLNETVTANIVIASFLILVGAILVSVNFNQIKLPLKPIFNILLCAFLVAIQTVLMKVFVNQEISVFILSFWMAVGFALASIIRLLLSRRLIFILIEKLKNSKGRIFILSCSQEISYFTSLTLSFYALKLAPAAGVVSSVMSVHALYVLILAVLFSHIFPDYFDDLRGKNKESRLLIIQRLCAIILIMTGISILGYFET